jgi:branched-chain amino acid transport system ATP-binding protein
VEEIEVTSLTVSGLSVRYGAGAQAVVGADLSVSSGECAVVHGPNGAGKTSLVRAIAGFLRHERVMVTGSIMLGERAIDAVGAERRARLGVACIPERDKIFREMSVRENLEIFALRRASKSGMKADLELALDVFPALERLPRGRAAGLLSGGEQQMLAIAGALVGGPQVLLVDEPSLGLAPIVVTDVMAALGRIQAERGLAVVLVDQNVRSARRIATKVYTMSGGRLQHETGEDVYGRLVREGYAKVIA